MKMKDLVERYLKTRRDGMAESTYLNIKATLDRLADSWDATRRVPGSMDEEWLRDWLYEFRNGGVGGRGERLAAASFNKTLTRLRGFLHYLVVRRVCEPFILDACQKLSPDEPKEYLRMTAAQVVHMIESCDDPWERWVLVVASQTLGRDSELRNRKVRHLHLDRSELDWYRKKTVDSDSLFVTAQLAEEWRRWAMVYQEWCGSIQPDWPLIPRRVSTPLGRYRWSYQTDGPPSRLAQIVQKHASRVTGLPVTALKGQGVHITRRSMARALYDRLVAEEYPWPIKPVQTALGHADPQTTMLYIGVQPDREERNRLLVGSNLLWVEQDNVVQLRSVGDA